MTTSEHVLDAGQVSALIKWAVSSTHRSSQVTLALGALRFAAVAAARLGDPQLLPDLLDGYETIQKWHPSEWHREVILSALATLVERRAGLEASIIELAKSPWSDLRATIAQALSEHEPASRELLLVLAADRAPGVRKAARASLGSYADPLPWWSGLVSSDPAPQLDADGLVQLQTVDERLDGHLVANARRALDPLPDAIAIDVLEGLLATADPVPIGYQNVLAALLEREGGLAALRAWLGRATPPALQQWTTWSDGTLQEVRAERRPQVLLALVDALLTPPGPQEAEGVRAVLAACLGQYRQIDGLDTKAAFERLLASAPADEAVHARAELCQRLIRCGKVTPEPIAQRIAEALSANDAATLARVGGARQGEALIKEAPPNVRDPYLIARIDQADEATQLTLLLDVLDDPNRSLGSPAEVARLTAMRARLLEQPPTDDSLWERCIPHRLGAARRELLERTLAHGRAAHLMLALGARVGGFARITPPTRDRRKGPTATAEEWAAYRACRDDAVAASAEGGYVEWCMTPALPPLGELSEEDWSHLEGALGFVLASPGHSATPLILSTLREVVEEEEGARAEAFLARLPVGVDDAE